MATRTRNPQARPIVLNYLAEHVGHTLSPQGVGRATRINNTTVQRVLKNCADGQIEGFNVKRLSRGIYQVDRAPDPRNRNQNLLGPHSGNNKLNITREPLPKEQFEIKSGQLFEFVGLTDDEDAVVRSEAGRLYRIQPIARMEVL